MQAMGLTNRKILFSLKGAFKKNFKKKEKILQHLSQSTQNALSELHEILELKVMKDKQIDLIRFK
jgi:hypothetical protein